MGQLTEFNGGGTHEENPLGGIPQGQAPDGSMNSVEQGESKKGNFIYSNRIALDKDLVKQFNLPGYVANKSVSAASKAIDDKFKDRQDKYAQETKNTLLESAIPIVLIRAQAEAAREMALRNIHKPVSLNTPVGGVPSNGTPMGIYQALMIEFEKQVKC
jgi:hypothetical protein